MIEWIVSNALLTGAGAGLITMIGVRLLPNDKLDAFFFNLGKMLTVGASTRLGGAFWNKVEDFLVNTIDACWDAFRRGLRSDNKKEE